MDVYDGRDVLGWAPSGPFCLNWDCGDLWVFVVVDEEGLRWVGVLIGEVLLWPLPFAPGHPHPGPLPLSGRGDVFLVGDGFSWRIGLWDAGFDEWWFLGESVILRRFASLPSQHLPGPFSNGPYGHPPLFVGGGLGSCAPFVLRTFPPRAGETRHFPTGFLLSQE